MTLTQLYKKCSITLEQNNIENSAFEAQCFIKKVFGINHTHLIAYGDREIDNKKAEALNELVNRRIKREPLQYLLGTWSFMGFDFEVGEGVLIPRDDTEVVVRLCIDYLKDKPSKKVIDLCSGSGAIAVAINKITASEVTAIELSKKAFCYLEKNIRRNFSAAKPLNLDILECHKGFPDGYFDLIVSNPPYIISDEIPLLQAEVQKEPAMALDGGADGYDFYRSIIKLWSSKLKKGGALAFELGEGQAETVKAMMAEKNFGNFRISDDFGGIHRAIIGTLL